MRTRGAARVALFATALGALCGCPDEPPPEIIKNTCLTDLNCGADDQTTCEQSTLMCVRVRTVQPYRVVLQVQPESTSVDIPDAGTVSLVSQAAFELGRFDRGGDNRTFELPIAVRKEGRVRGPLDGSVAFLESELTLTPHMNEARLSATVVNSGRMPERSDAGEVNVDMLLDETLSYDLSVQPLLSASEQLPPYRSSMPYTPDPKGPLEVEYGEIGKNSARFASLQSGNSAQQRVRLEEKATGQVVSSINVVNSIEPDAGAASGSFTLYAAPEVLNDLSKYNLVVGLDAVGGSEFPRWQVKLVVDGTRFTPGATINLPAIPQPQHLQGTLAPEGSSAPLANAELEFVSTFPVTAGYEGRSNWCGLPTNQPWPGLTCSARRRTRSDASGRFEIDLLPGVYDLFVLPDRSASPDRANLAIDDLRVESGGDMPQYIPVSAASRYDAVVRSPQHQAMPNVTVRARALGVYEPEFNDDLESELARYNRSMTSVTNSRGEFSLWPDIGRYDFSVETPSESGFAWMLCPNYQIKPRNPPTRISLLPFYPPYPVILGGTLHHSGVKLSGARVDAYAVWDTEPARLLLVGRAVTDSEGKFRVAMPPQLPPTDPDATQSCPIVFDPPVTTSSMDAGATLTLDSALSER